MRETQSLIVQIDQIYTPFWKVKVRKGRIHAEMRLIKTHYQRGEYYEEKEDER